MNFAIRIIPWIILAVPFVVLTFFYNSIGNDILIARSLFGNETVSAPKSLFTVFRVPLIEVVCAALVETIRPKMSDSDYFSIWNVLLYTVAFKSLFQFFEFVSLSIFPSQTKADFFFYATAAIVACGIFLTFLRGWKFFFSSAQKNWNLTLSKMIFLGILLILYVVLALVPVITFKTA
jgi:hypothetical protein